ncbi:citrate/2-methylcitrate synthase [Methylobacterium sp. E-066]|uniref:citrate/2-methylcitrate synthase n=1 Tax=Methylobacterium sp. E-066 TaxID=2836584 RepID=UPI001FBA83CD|nr:citrate/2-methylcitrate synthase [Methylobacterium sp. E-066]MCJ2142239.1 hypothetical protein [Methylobacterium sp. E-066]
MAVAVTAQEILAHPRFAEARAAHVSAVVELFKADALAMRMMADAGIIILRGFIVGFHFAFDPEDRNTWATPGNVRRILVERGLASPRRVDDLLARFRQAGYLEAASAPDDRRVTILVPTARVIAHDRHHLAAYHRFLLDLFPGRGYEWALEQDERTHRLIRLSGLRDPRAAALLASFEPPEPVTRMISKVEATTGLRPTIDVALAALTERYDLPEDAPFALFAIGRSVGWLAHSIEQVASQIIIRPRAKYIGLKLNN